MTTLTSEGVSVDLPRGWEGSLAAREAPPAADGDVATLGRPRPAPVTLHAANFALPSARGDFGGGAVELMASGDIFMSLVEFGPESAGTALFADPRVPRLRPVDFDPFVLQRVIHGQVGVQRFFTTNGRAFCLYVVLGRETMRLPLVRQANAVVDSLSIRAG